MTLLQQHLHSCPDALVYQIIRFLVPRCSTSFAICHRLRPLSKGISSIFGDETELWGLVATEYSTQDQGGGEKHVAVALTPSRSSKRLRRTLKMTVVDAHRLLCSRTETAHFQLTEMTHSRDRPLTLARLRKIMKTEDGSPMLRVNQRASVGGTLLIECCRARFVGERVIVLCVRELVEKWGADVDVATGVGPGEGGAGGLTALSIGSARGMPALVKYLFGRGADRTKSGQGRFRLFGNNAASVGGNHTPLQWARAMLAAEVEAGVEGGDLECLRECIRILD